jgi:hypothetical protein
MSSFENRHIFSGRAVYRYKGHAVGEYFADLLVEDVLVIELKCVERLANEHIAQCLNYQRASGRTLCLLVNFQKPKVEWKRIVHRFQVPELPQAPAARSELLMSAGDFE